MRILEHWRHCPAKALVPVLQQSRTSETWWMADAQSRETRVNVTFVVHQLT